MVEKLTGYTPSEFIGTHLQQYLTETEIHKMEQIIQDHNGNIGIETNLGEFTRFMIDLPAFQELEDEFVSVGATL